MIYPPLSSLTTKAENKYTLVIEVAKRARQLVSGANPLIDVESESEKPVSIAVREVNEDLVTYHRN
ncbi:MAG: DNA-directed RNA polymerase subunit omega [Clostridiales bacterium]|nr:DNA-directed RNA polymerase subunit omega [Clostridiales bacterium]